jgi:hypothetical protein
VSPRAEADGEGFNADAAEFGDGEVAELVDQDHDAEDDSEEDDGLNDLHEVCVATFGKKKQVLRSTQDNYLFI